MNAVGIDYQRTATVAWVREEGRAVVVGDGWRTRIPTAIGRDLWGSAALAADLHTWGGNDLDSRGPWPSPATSDQFWRGLYDRLTRFLGRTEPLARNGYPCIVTGERLTEPARTAAIHRTVVAAGFDPPSFTPAIDALLVRWLVDAESRSSSEQTVILVAVGDSGAEAAARVVRFDLYGLPIVSAKSATTAIENVGHAWLQDRLFRLVRDRLAEPLPRSNAPILYDAILEFAQSLGKKSVDSSEWTGSFRGRMYSSFHVSLDDVRSWPESSRAAKELPRAVASCLREVGRKQADAIVVGGTGAAWPHIAAALAGLGPPVWQSGDPSNDLAIGAAWLPVYSDRLGLGATLASLPALPTAAIPKPAPPAPTAENLPPWLRRGEE